MTSSSKMSIEDVKSHPAVIFTVPVPDIENPSAVMNSTEKVKKKSFFNKKIAFLCVLYVCFFLRGAVKSIYNPFFPQVANEKGASATEYGFVFGIFDLTALLVTPIIGSKIKTIGTGRMCIAGILLTSLFSGLFGLLPSLEVSKNAFIGICLAVRCLESLGESAFLTAAYAIIATEFSDTVATNFARTEAIWCVGKMIGPTLGGFLYELGGFSLPFYSMGGSLFIFALATCKVFLTEEPKVNSFKGSLNDFNDATKTPTMLDLIKIPVVAMTLYSVLVTSISYGFVNTLLEGHLRQFKLSKTAIGSVFLLGATANAVSVPFLGNLCDRMKNPKLLTLFGSVIVILGVAMIGPLPFLPFDTNLWVSCAGLIPFYVGFGAVVVSTFRIILTDVNDKGYPEDVSIRGLVSGLWKTTTLIGSFIGCTLGGFLDDFVGFRWGSVVVIGVDMILVVVLIIFLVKARGCALLSQKV